MGRFISSNQGDTILISACPPISSWCLPLQDTTQCLCKLSNKTVISQGLDLHQIVPLPAIAPLSDVMGGGSLAPRPVRFLPCTDTMAAQAKSQELSMVSLESLESRIAQDNGADGQEA